MEYIDKVIQCLHSDEKNHDAERRREVAEQKLLLLDLKVVLEARGRGESSVGEAMFSAALDDDEMLLRLMYFLDKDESGAISEVELLASEGLMLDMRAALESAFRCSPETMEAALAHLDDCNFGRFRRVKGAGKEAAQGQEGVFDAKASARAVFNAALCPAALSQPPATCDGQVCSSATKDAEAGANGAEADSLARCDPKASKAGLERLADCLGGVEALPKLATALRVLAKTLQDEGKELDLLGVKRAAQRVPRVMGQRVEWARSLQLDAALARHLPPGTPEDGLAGVRRMSNGEAERALAAFLKDARARFLKALLDARQATGSKSAYEANRKFTDGFEGSFATLQEFHAGAEASLNLGYPNPDTIKGMRLEHTAHPSAERLFVTPNYRIATCLLLEYAWAMLESEERTMADPEMRALQSRASDILADLARKREEHSPAPADGAATAARTDAAATELGRAAALFPGEVGDGFWEALVVLRFPDSDPVDLEAVKMRVAAAQNGAKAVLGTEEELVRGVATLDHAECAQRIARGANVLASGCAAANKQGPVLVGLLLPMTLARATAKLDALRAAVGMEVEVETTGCKRWTFSRHTGVEEVKKMLGERSLEDLRKMLADDARAEEGKREWTGVASAEGETHAALCSEMVTAFVRTELRLDLRAALESSASDAQIRALLEGWTVLVPDEASRAERIFKAALALNFEEQWRQVEAWVRLHRGRIQGRTRLGLEGLMRREESKVKQYKLTKSEVLGIYLYTGLHPRRLFSSLILDQLRISACVGRAGVCADERHLPELPARYREAAQGRWNGWRQQAVHDALLHFLGPQEALPDHALA